MMKIAEYPSSERLARARIGRLLTRPSVWFPALISATALSLAAVQGGWTSWVGITGLIALAGAAAGAAIHWFFRRDALQRAALAKVARDTAREELERLQDLRVALRKDRDPHSTQLVRQLRDTLDRLVQMLTDEWGRPSRRSVRLENLGTSAALYGSCQRLLRRSLQLWQVAQDVGTAATRDRLLHERSQLLQQVEQSIHHLDASLDQLQTDALRHDGSSLENQHLQDELRMGLETARRVEERMDSLEQELRFHDRLEGGE